MITDCRQTRERIFNQFSPETQRLFANRKNDIYTATSAFPLILEMLYMENTMKTAKPGKPESIMNQAEEPLTAGVSVEKDPRTGLLITRVLKKESITNQGEELEYINGVQFYYDHKLGKMVAKGA